MAVSGVMAATAVGSAVASGVAGSKAASAQKKAAMLAAARQQQVTDQNLATTKDIYGQSTGLANANYTQQLSDNAQAYGDATGAIGTGYDTAGNEVRQGYGQAIDTLSPFASPNALMQLHDMAGIARPGEATARDYDFQSTDPSYKWRLEQGQEALDRSAASRGMLLSGAQLRGSQEFGQNAASQEYGAQFGRVSGMADDAQRGAAGISALQQGQGSALADLATGRGTALGNLAIGQGTALNSLGQTNLGNLTTLNTNYGNNLVDIRQSGVNNVNANNQNAAAARASGYLSTGAAIQNGLSGLSGAYAGSSYGSGANLLPPRPIA
jgi:hypothetical protein